MAIVEETVTRFTTSDGQFFFWREEALAHEAYQELLEHVGPLFRGLESPEDKIMERVCESAAEILKYLQPFALAKALLLPERRKS